MKKVLQTFVVLISATIILLTGVLPIAAAEGVDVNENPQGDIAYANFYGNLEGRYASFIDGISLGIKESSDPLYFEQVTLDGLEARKQYSGNSAYINVDEEFFEKEDCEFLVNIYYYDFGPYEGKYQFEYHTQTGGLNKVTIYKPGRHPGWRYVSVVLTDGDLSGLYDNGATFRIENGAYNAWRRVEIVNISRLRREGKAIEGIAALGHVKIRDLEKSGIITIDDPMFEQANAAKTCTLYDVLNVLARYKCEAANASEETKNQTVTQGELLKLFMDVVKVDYKSAPSIVDFAIETAFIAKDGLFTTDDAPATYYNMLTAIEGLVYYKDKDDNPYIVQMYEKGFFGDVDITETTDNELLAAYFKTPRYLPYRKVTDNGTGRTYNFVDFYGNNLIRGYLTQPHWLFDGIRFFCTTSSGHLYIYNTETQMIQYLRHTGTYGATLGEDGMLYTWTTDGAMKALVRIDVNDPNYAEKIVYRLPPGVSVSMETISADGKWFGGSTADTMGMLGEHPKDKDLLVNFFINEDSQPGVADYNYKINYYQFPQPERGFIGHVQANPGYSNLIFFCHEGGDAANTWEYTHAWDRVNVMNLDTGKVWTAHPGLTQNTRGIQLFTHDTWSPDGEYVYFVTWTEVNVASGIDHYGAVRVDKDGRHRQYFDSNDYGTSFNHCNVGGENMDWISYDSYFVGAMNSNTHQTFPIANYGNHVGVGSGQEYHGHAQVSRVGNILSWGTTLNGVLGVAWYDLDQLVESGELAQGGRYDINEYVEAVSYKGLECESEQVVKDGKDCQMTKAGAGIYYAINPDIVDTTDDAIRITFDYLDNSKNPITVTYTKGIKEPNDILNVSNGQISMQRTGTGRWKQGVIEIDSINCESPCKFYSDFALTGGSTNLYITNMKVERIEK